MKPNCEAVVLVCSQPPTDRKDTPVGLVPMNQGDVVAQYKIDSLVLAQ